MPRTKNETGALAADLKDRIDRIVEAATREGHDAALAELRALVSGGTEPARRGPGRPRKDAGAPAAPRRSRKNPWASMTPEQRAERVKKMLAGRGLQPKVKD